MKLFFIPFVFVSLFVAGSLTSFSIHMEEKPELKTEQLKLVDIEEDRYIFENLNNDRFEILREFERNTLLKDNSLTSNKGKIYCVRYYTPKKSNYTSVDSDEVIAIWEVASEVAYR